MDYGGAEEFELLLQYTRGDEREDRSEMIHSILFHAEEIKRRGVFDSVSESLRFFPTQRLCVNFLRTAGSYCFFVVRTRTQSASPALLCSGGVNECDATCSGGEFIG